MILSNDYLYMPVDYLSHKLAVMTMCGLTVRLTKKPHKVFNKIINNNCTVLGRYSGTCTRVLYSSTLYEYS